MARIRTIKPEFFTSEDIVSLSPLARLLYVALWCEADREGRMQWKPRTFKMRYLPADEIDINTLCDEIVEAGLVKLYGDGLAFIPKFGQHQHLNPRETPSSLPDPHALTTRDQRVSTRADTVDASSVTHREEGKGKEGDTRVTRASVHGFPPGFEVLWAEYPRKVGKDAAAKAFAKRKPDAKLLDAMVAAVKAQKSSPAWTKEGGQFIPYLSTWLNDGRWMDEQPTATIDPDLADMFRRGER